MDVTMLLCDAAEIANGKLYILGGGWSELYSPDQPTIMAIATVFHIGWTESNKLHDVIVELKTEDGEPFVGPDGNPVSIPFNVEVGRPPGSKPGTTFTVPSVFNVQGLSFPKGGYVFELSVDGTVMVRRSFTVDLPK